MCILLRILTVIPFVVGLTNFPIKSYETFKLKNGNVTVLKAVQTSANSWYKWIDSSDDTQWVQNAMQGGRDKNGSKLYVIRAPYSSELCIGKYNYDQKFAAVPFDGREQVVKYFQILTGSDEGLEWEYSTGDIPRGAIQGGKTVDGNELYIGRAYHESSLTPGQIVQNSLFISFGWKVHKKTKFEVLVFT